ncbi:MULTISPECIES: flagellin [Hydrogenophaga]|jgi:flagellin|uniref:Flagellin n=2 Tax=Hydrogenophaga intermedia TaxID=65786 RepID=A0A1L1PR72_HYDIT|nr:MULTISPECIES: flagellin [Hydrogenophaga]AOS77788.1 flagellin [Hydrogenophaga sp. PBC]TMU75938.1 flagellin [Hydrogenophaga intermedia]CDN90259.1 Flagellin-related hook-associated protein [Hydrogenophaga intermedia]
MTTINTNMMSMTAQRNLATSAGSLATSMQRLSSGLRVNSAKDDAAGLAISERMNTQVRGLSVAARNANDGISLAQVAEGALGKVGDMLQRMRELAVQSANASNNADDRKALQAEVTQLRQEVERVAKTTAFNGTKLLDGTFANVTFQVGANAGEGISIESIVSARVDDIGATDFNITPAINNLADPVAPAVLAAVAAGTLEILDADGNAVPLGPIGEATTGAQRTTQVVDAINAKSSDTGVFARPVLDATGAVTGYEIFSDRALDTAAGEALESLAGAAADVGTVVATAPTAAPFTLEDINIENFGDSQLAMKVIDNAIDAINSSRADLGALQSRFESAVANINITGENLSAARGRIVDADFAKETSNLSRAQILQQAGTAMVAQANQIPQNVLSLLGR